MRFAPRSDIARLSRTADIRLLPTKAIVCLLYSLDTTACDREDCKSSSAILDLDLYSCSLRADSDFDTNGYPRGVKRGFTNEFDALAYCDIFTYHTAGLRIKAARQTLHQWTSHLANSGLRTMSFKDRPALQPRQVNVSKDNYTVSVVPLSYVPTFAMPTTLVALVAGHRVEIDFVCPYLSLPTPYTDARAGRHAQL